MKKGYILIWIAIILSNIMCFVVGYNYRSMICNIEHNGASAPSSLALLYALPFILIISICLMISSRVNKRII